MEHNPEYLRIPEVAELLRISRNRAYDLAATDPTFPAIAIGRRLIVSRKDLEAWLTHKQRGPRT
jgi:excisionase family DNA binding protein